MWPGPGSRWRKRVLPKRLGLVGAHTRRPLAGSLVQSTLALIVVVIFAVAGADPILAVFTWLSGISADGVILLMAGTSAAVVGFFRRRPSEENVWQRAISAHAGGGDLLALVVLLIDNFDTLLGRSPIRRYAEYSRHSCWLQRSWVSSGAGFVAPSRRFTEGIG